MHRICRASHHREIDCLLLPASLSSLGRPRCTQFSTFPQLWVNHWIESQLPPRLPPELPPPHWPPPCTHPILLDPGFQVHLHTRSITAFKCIFNPAWLRPASVSLNLHYYGLQVRNITASKCIFNLTRLRPGSVSPNSRDYGLPVCMIRASNCISKLAWSPPRSISRSSLDHDVVHRWI